MHYKYSKPANDAESKCRFLMLEHNGDRVKIQCVADQFGPVKSRILPVEVIPAYEVEPA
jgi:hypothetical protein